MGFGGGNSKGRSISTDYPPPQETSTPVVDPLPIAPLTPTEMETPAPVATPSPVTQLTQAEVALPKATDVQPQASFSLPVSTPSPVTPISVPEAAQVPVLGNTQAVYAGQRQKQAAIAAKGMGFSNTIRTSPEGTKETLSTSKQSLSPYKPTFLGGPGGI